jgi:uncharacterized protein (TIGR03086 family)
MAAVLARVDDSQLSLPTPCRALCVGDVIDHVGILSRAFTERAAKQPRGAGGPPPEPSAANLGPGWCGRIAADLETLASAWRAPDAWEGTTTAGGGEFPAATVGAIVLDELVVHGWDIAVATGQPYAAPDDEVAAAADLVNSLDDLRKAAGDKLFGPAVEVAADAPPLDRLLGRTGRDPGWRPAAP